MVQPFSQSDAPYLGTGLSFPLRVNVQGQLMLSSGDRNIEESIHIILRTTIGERVGLSQFGSNLEDMAFDPLNSSTLVLLRIAVEEALQRWEPRIELDEVQAVPNPAKGRVDLVLSYRVINEYNSRSLIYPFYLQLAEEQASKPAAAPVYGQPV